MYAQISETFAARSTQKLQTSTSCSDIFYNCSNPTVVKIPDISPHSGSVPKSNGLLLARDPTHCQKFSKNSWTIS